MRVPPYQPVTSGSLLGSLNKVKYVEDKKFHFLEAGWSGVLRTKVEGCGKVPNSHFSRVLGFELGKQTKI